jgi:hypothetical protein
MKTLIRIIVFVFITSLFSVSYGANKTINFQYFNTIQKHNISFSQIPNTLKSFMYNDGGCSSTPYFIEGLLILSGSMMYWDYNPYYYDDENRGLGLVFMACGITGYILQSVGYSHSSNNNKYHHRSSMDKKQNIQFALNGSGLGLKMSF